MFAIFESFNIVKTYVVELVDGDGEGKFNYVPYGEYYNLNTDFTNFTIFDFKVDAMGTDKRTSESAMEYLSKKENEVTNPKECITRNIQSTYFADVPWPLDPIRSDLYEGQINPTYVVDLLHPN